MFMPNIMQEKIVILKKECINKRQDQKNTYFVQI